MRIVPLLLLLVAAALAAPEDTRPIVVELADGSRFAGRVVEEECTDDLLVMRQIRTLAKREIPWDDVAEGQRRELRVQLGFEVAEARGGMRIQGSEIRNRAGTVFVGLLENAKTAEKDGEYRMRTVDGVLRIPLTDVREGPTPVEVDALAIYSPQELYEAKLAEKAPETAEDHFRLGEFARTMGALEQAKKHYEAVIALEDPKYPASTVQRLLDRVNKRIGSREAEDALRQIKRSIVYNQFQRAAEELAAFKEAYGSDEDLLKDAADLEEELRQERDAYYTSQVTKGLRDKVRDLLGEKVKEPELSLRQGTQYAGGEPSDEKSVSHAALLALGEKLGITPQEALEYWKRRSVRSTYKAFYRDGTFIVLDNMQDALARAPRPKPTKRGQKAPKPPAPHPILTPDTWWNGKIATKKYADLRDWLFAFWAERSGMVEVMEPKMETCPVCAGKGYTASMFTSPEGSVPFYDRCQNCFMATGFRVVRFR